MRDVSEKKGCIPYLNHLFATIELFGHCCKKGEVILWQKRITISLTQNLLRIWGAYGKIFTEIPNDRCAQENPMQEGSEGCSSPMAG